MELLQSSMLGSALVLQILGAMWIVLAVFKNPTMPDRAQYYLGAGVFWILRSLWVMISFMLPHPYAGMLGLMAHAISLAAVACLLFVCFKLSLEAWKKLILVAWSLLVLVSMYLGLETRLSYEPLLAEIANASALLALGAWLLLSRTRLDTAWSKGKTLALLGATGLAVAAGLFVAHRSGEYQVRRMSQKLQLVSSVGASALDSVKISKLTATVADENKPHTLRLRQQLMAMTAADKEIRRIYLMALREGKVLFTIDSVPVGDNGHVLSGEPYEDAPKRLAEALRDSKLLVIGPYSDKWGKWTSCFVPLKSSGLPSVMRIDISADNWAGQIFSHQFVHLLLGIISAALIILFFFYRVEDTRRQLALEGERVRYRDLAAAGSDWHWEADSHGKLSYASEGVSKLLGYGPAEVEGNSLFDYLTQEERKRSEPNLLSILQAGNPLLDCELSFRHQDGSIRFLMVNAKPTLHQGVLAYRGAAKDITLRILNDRALTKSYAALEREKANLKAVFDTVPTGLILLDEHARIKQVNDVLASIVGKDLAGALNLQPGDAMGCLVAAHAAKGCGSGEKCASCPVRRSIGIVLASGYGVKDVQYEQEFLAQGVQKKVWLELNAMPVSIDERPHVLIALSDITERHNLQNQQRDLESQLMGAQKLESVGRLASGVAHEINTPVQFIGDNLRFIKESNVSMLATLQTLKQMASEPDAACPKALDLIEKLDLDYLVQELPAATDQGLDGIERISRIVKAMKAFAHPDSNHKAPANINVEIDSTVVVARNEWKYVAEVEMNFSEDPKLKQVPCHRGELNQVILNLIVNAAHAIQDKGLALGEKGTITLSTSCEEGMAVIRVADTGMGIKPEHQARIFEPFFTTKEVGRGTGQGLAMAFNVVNKRHGGSVSFETEVGKGTTFILRLPLDDAFGGQA
jgi:PAS domain S-box-containing protein